MASSAEIKGEPAVTFKPEQVPAGAASTGRQRRRLWRIVRSAALAIAVVAAVLAVRTRTRPIRLSSARTPSGSRASRTIRLNGTTEAVRMIAIVAPVVEGEQVGSLTITRLAPSGSRVKQGDVLAEFDRQAQLREVIEKQSEQAKLAGQVGEEQAKEAAARAKDETEMRAAENKLKQAELELGKLELMSRIDAEKAQQDLEESQATLAQLRETFQLKRQRARAGIRLLEIQRDRSQEIMEHARDSAERMQIRSTLEGVVVLTSIWKEGTMGEVQEGDQVRPGVTFMQVVDPSAMQVRALANQQDFLWLQPGQTAKVYFDAYPELEFAAKLEEMAPVGRSGNFSSKLRTFSVVFSIAGSDPRLMPDLSAAVDVERTAQAGAFAPFR